MAGVFSGKDCSLHHGGKRYVKTRKCVECVRLTRARNTGKTKLSAPPKPPRSEPNIARSSFIRPITIEMLMAGRAP